MYNAEDHTFVVCAYKKSEYLEECIQSLKNQTVMSTIIITTSTPNPFIEELARKYQCQFYVNDGIGGIANDWNFGLQNAKTKLATIAHQDDVYCAEYTERMLEAVNGVKAPLIFFSDYGELRNGERVTNTELLKIKRIMLLPLRIKGMSSKRWIRRRILSFGSPISCPTVTYCLTNLQRPIFAQHYRGGVDWEAWEKISRQKGDFVYSSQVLMYHRIHDASETSAIIKDSVRTEEDYEMFCKFWPKPIAKIIAQMYRKSQQSNEL